MVYAFKTQLSKGERAEAELTKHFEEWFVIREVSRAEQRAGIDRIFQPKDGGPVLKVEMKTDWTASKTGNAFVETISVDTTGKKGWAYTSQADVLLYYLPDDLLIYWMPFATLRFHLPRWCQYPTRKITNSGYCTYGLLVPLAEFEKYADQVISI
jgi:hypothetical protein